MTLWQTVRGTRLDSSSFTDNENQDGPKVTHSVVLNLSTNLNMVEMDGDLSGTFKTWGSSLVTGSLIRQTEYFCPTFSVLGRWASVCSHEYSKIIRNSSSCHSCCVFSVLISCNAPLGDPKVSGDSQSSHRDRESEWKLAMPGGCSIHSLMIASDLHIPANSSPRHFSPCGDE